MAFFNLNFAKKLSKRGAPGRMIGGRPGPRPSDLRITPLAANFFVKNRLKLLIYAK